MNEGVGVNWSLVELMVTLVFVFSGGSFKLLRRSLGGRSAD